MKRLLLLALLASGLLFTSMPAHGAAALDLSGNDYKVYIFCLDDVGDFCQQGKLTQDEFLFDGDTFGIGSFEEALGGLAGNGNFSGGAFSFDADYSALDGLNTYDFTINGISIVDTILLGKMDISYSEFVLALPPRTDEEDGTAFFIGIKQ